MMRAIAAQQDIEMVKEERIFVAKYWILNSIVKRWEVGAAPTELCWLSCDETGFRTVMS
jgi:hypothetical protein